MKLTTQQAKNLLLTLPILAGLTLSGCTEADQSASGLAAFFPIKADTLVTFTVEGFDIPGTRTIYNTYVRGNRTQRMVLATDFPPSLEIVKVGADQVSLIFGDPHHYSVEDLTDVSPAQEIIILQAPVEVGTSWDKGGLPSAITSVDALVETPLGTFTAVQVTTTLPDGSQERFYYAEGIGLIKSVHPNPLNTFTVTLYSIETDVPAAIPVAMLFPNITDNVIIVEPRTLRLPTNADFVPQLAQELSTAPNPDTLPLLPHADAINSIEIFRAQSLAHVDLNSSFREWNDLGDGTIGTVFMALTNTIGLFAEVNHVSYSIDGAPFTWGPIMLAEGEAVRVHDFSEITGQ